MPRLSERTIRIIKTSNLYLSFLGEGMMVAITGPTLLDLQHLVNTDLQQIAIIYTARSAGAAIGSVGGGILFDLIKRKQLILTIFSLISAFTIFALPWSRSIGILTVFMVSNGISLGISDTGVNVCCLNLWGKDSGPYYQALHFTFGVGGLIAPLIAAPFVGSYEWDDLNNNTMPYIAWNGTQLHVLDNVSMVTSEIPKVTYAYTIIGVYQLIVTAFFLMVCIISPYDINAEKQSGAKTRKRSLSFIMLIVFLNVILLFVETGTEIGYAQMLATYVVKSDMHLSVTLGSYMTSAFWAAFTVSRFISVFLSIKIKSLTLIVFDLIITAIGAAILLLLGGTKEWALWLSSVLLGIGIASFYPAAVSWTDKYIAVTNKIASSFAIGAIFGEMFIPYTISHFIDQVPEVLAYVVVASCVFCTLITLVLYFIYRNMQEKYLEDEGTENPALDVNSMNNLKI